MLISLPVVVIKTRPSCRSGGIRCNSLIQARLCMVILKLVTEAGTIFYSQPSSESSGARVRFLSPLQDFSRCGLSDEREMLIYCGTRFLVCEPRETRLESYPTAPWFPTLRRPLGAERRLGNRLLAGSQRRFD